MWVQMDSLLQRSMVWLNFSKRIRLCYAKEGAKPALLNIIQVSVFDVMSKSWHFWVGTQWNMCNTNIEAANKLH